MSACVSFNLNAEVNAVRPQSLRRFLLSSEPSLRIRAVQPSLTTCLARASANAIVGAGSVITRDVPADALALGRGEQVEKPGAARVLRAAGADAKRRRAQGKQRGKV